MARTYAQTGGANGCANAQYCATVGPGAGTARQSQIVEAGSSGGEVTITHSGATGNQALFFMQPDVAPNANIDAGTWTIRLNVTTAQMFLTWDAVYVCKLSAACANLATIGSATGLGLGLGSTGVLTANVSGGSTSMAATDTFIIICEFSNSQTMSNSAGITRDQNIDTPVQEVAANPIPDLAMPTRRPT